MSDANRQTSHILAAMAEPEWEIISRRTKAALPAQRSSSPEPETPATSRTPAKVLKLIADQRAAGVSLREIARELNQLSIKTPRGNQ